MSNLMSAYSSQGIDGILSEGGGGHAIVQSLKPEWHRSCLYPHLEGEMFNAWMKDWVELDPWMLSALPSLRTSLPLLWMWL